MVSNERDGLSEHLAELWAELDEQEGRANFWERKAKEYRRQMAEERAKVRRIAAVVNDEFGFTYDAIRAALADPEATP